MAWCLVVALGFGCTARQEPSLAANEPEGQVLGILEATRDADASAIPQLVALLDSDDPLVRMLSIRSLERLTGRTMGYRHDLPPTERSEAVGRWVRWVEAGSPGGPSEQAGSEAGLASPEAGLAGLEAGLAGETGAAR